MSVIDPYVPERGNSGYDVVHYDLELDYNIGSNHLAGRARLRMIASAVLPLLSLDLVGLRVSKVIVDGQDARWRQRGGKVHVTPTAPLQPGAETEVELRYAGKPGPTSSRWGSVGWEELEDGVMVAAQPSGASTWFPCNDLAGQKASFVVTVTAASSYRVVVNGALRHRQTNGSTTTWSYTQAEPTSPYLMTVHVGRYVEHEVRAEPVSIRAHFASEHRSDYLAAFARLPEMMDLYLDSFGPYPFEAGYTVVVCPDELEIPLEAQGQAVFGSNHLRGDDERLIAHELAHQWFGNSLTAARWRDIWLHEGFACYAEWLWSEGSGAASADELARRHHGRLRDLPQDLLLIEPGPDTMFDDRVYKRGALALHALRLEVGDAPFFELLRRWTSTYSHGLVTTEQFEALAAEVAGRSLEVLFGAWLRSVPLPPLSPAGG